MREMVVEALAALAGPGLGVTATGDSVPGTPGLYAIHGAAPVWRKLRLGEPPDDRPLYVGKAERSLASRDVKTHFGTGKTGSSTVRRTLAALLRDDLRLAAQPRNTARPSHFPNYGLEPEGDARLTQWMVAYLTLATWSSPVGEVVLGDVETHVLARLLPPLNIDKVRTPWRSQVQAARRVMAAQAREWHAD